MSTPGVVIIGAGPAGLACAACLRQAGVEATILEQAGEVGASWRQHYDRLHLHTDRAHSALPGLAMPAHLPRYPSRTQVVDYLRDYGSAFDLRPRFGIEARRAALAGDAWRVETSAGPLAARHLIVATGTAGFPHRPAWPGEAWFGGSIVHSSAYRSPAPYKGQRVLVVGFGNSGAEIALDLAEAGADVAVSLRGPVNIVPRDVLGIPILAIAILLRPLPPPVADALAAPIVRLALGKPARLGLPRTPSGPFASIATRGQVPVLDIGTVAAIRAGRIAIRPAVQSLGAGMVAFTDGRHEAFDAIIAATGFRPDLRTLLPAATDTLDAAGAPRRSGEPTSQAGLYFCGFHVSPAGQLREIGREARRIAAEIVARPR